MDIRNRLNDKLSKMLFLELKKDRQIGNYVVKENIYVPVKSSSITSRVKNGENIKDIPMSFFIEGMFFVLGADKDFRFNEMYKEFIESTDHSVPFIKNVIYHKVKDEEIEDAYILTKGLSRIEPSTEVYDRLLVLLERLREKYEEYEEEELYVIDEGKKIPNYATPYLYESLVCRDKGEFEKATAVLYRYFELGGEENQGVSKFKKELENINTYNKGKELCTENPEEALKLLIPLVDEFEDSANIYYYIAVAYRAMENYAKAIYYLNEAYTRDEALIEVINEYGINYASIGEFEKAAKYFERAFRESRTVEICTNVVMCYLNIKDYENASKFLEEAKKISPQDEIVLELEDYLKNENSF
ncbi:Tetratricopeptide repeat-containing protein [Hathewaya proteolytica DSM 3090]|uniref:Tetratricopeptide repeat-containing protein n=1 Tax=Hathewaya proteolytica DSM 3090 TaxID=1121331 RepID=A0A1M6QTD7_9CLOT|nr:tetratricopeptide repeat protein [Hathewaya proteolytica]SHK23368.1 Tetratricopeptide repeat-containing protein [Hathewaya proteolytica DSM 3090]